MKHVHNLTPTSNPQLLKPRRPAHTQPANVTERVWLTSSHPFSRVERMEVSVAVAVLEEVFRDVIDADATAVTACLRASRRLRSALDARDANLHRMLASLTSYPEKVIADTEQSTVKAAQKKMRRAATAAEQPVLGEALGDGKITGEHIDAYGRAERDLSPSERKCLGEHTTRLTLVGQHGSFDDFEHELKKAVVRVREDDGTERLLRQQRSTRLRSWIDRDDGMYVIHGRFDPVTGIRIAQQLADAVEAKFAERIPDNCPEEPGAKQDFLRAHAFISILSGGGMAVGRPEFIVVIDERHVGPDGEPIVDFGQPFDIPWSVIQAMRANARNYRVVVRDGAIVSAQGTLNLERSTRLANRAQRRALRALYPTCAIPGCGVRYGYTSIHHVIWWEHHGPTNLDNLLPLCSRHHHKVHDDGWRLNLKPNRQLTIALPDGTTMTTGPPKRCVA